jgi:hypothetical protein
MRSSQFTFLVGEEKIPHMIHTAVLEKLSAPLHALVSNGSMKESQTGIATLDDVDLETFIGFCEFAYTDTYQTPTRKNDAESTRTGVAKPNRISKRPRVHNEKLKKLRLECNQSYHGYRLSSKDFVDYHFASVWDSFESRTYSGGVAKSTLSPYLMFHAKLCVFSTKYVIEPLREKCLEKLHADLQDHNLTSETSYLILDLLEYVYANTGRTEPTGNSSLRDLIIHYVACKLNILSNHGDFFTILESNAQIGLDLVMEMLK